MHIYRTQIHTHTRMIFPTDSGDGDSADQFSLKNQTLNDESMLLFMPVLSSDGEAEDNMVKESEPTLFTEKMVSDKNHTSITTIPGITYWHKLAATDFSRYCTYYSPSETGLLKKCWQHPCTYRPG